MCLCLVGTLLEDVSNKYRGESQITEIVFSSIWGNFVLNETALLLFSSFPEAGCVLRCPKYQGNEPMLIVWHNECSEWMLFCFPEIMSVFSRKIFLFSKQLQTICSDQITCLNFYSNGEMFDVSAPNRNTHWWRIQQFQR